MLHGVPVMSFPCMLGTCYCLLSLHDCSLRTRHAAPRLWWCLQACSGAGKNEEAVKGMEQLCGVKAEAAGPSVVRSVQAAGVSLEAQLQVSHCRSSQHHLWHEGGDPAAPSLGSFSAMKGGPMEWIAQVGERFSQSWSLPNSGVQLHLGISRRDDSPSVLADKPSPQGKASSLTWEQFKQVMVMA